MAPRPTITAMLVAVLGIAPAFAGESLLGLYAGAEVGRSTVHLRNDALARELTASGFGFSEVSSDNSDMAWKALLGYRFNRNFGLEVAISPSGEVSQQTVLTSFAGFAIPPTPFVIRYKSEDTATFSALGILPIGPLSVYGRLGRYTTRVTAKGSAPSLGFFVDESTRAQGWLLGIGGSYDIGRRVSMRLGVERLKQVGNEGRIHKSDADFVSLGLVYWFRHTGN
jgi:opacity protein-like surface antigen